MFCSDGMFFTEYRLIIATWTITIIEHNNILNNTNNIHIHKKIVIISRLLMSCVCSTYRFQISSRAPLWIIIHKDVRRAQGTSAYGV